MSTPRIKSLVAAACGMAACTPPQPGSPTGDADRVGTGATNIVDVPTPATAPSATELQANDDGGGISGGRVPPSDATARARPELRALFELPAWERLRRGWRRLDAVELDEGDVGPSFSPHPEVEGIVAEMDRVLDELSEAEPAKRLDPALLPTLRAVVSTRGAVLTGLRTRLMVMHRMPTPAERAVARVGGALEQRIDALVALRAQAAVPSKAYEAGLEAVGERVLLLAVLREVRGGLSFEPVPRAETLAELERMLAERRASASADAGSTALDDLERALGEARRLAPDVLAMVADLER